MTSAKSTKTQALVYERYSPRRDEEDSKSLENQDAECRDYCRTKGYDLAIEPFADPALSGGDEDRPQLWLAIAALKRGWVLVCYSTSRLARSVYLREVIRRQVKSRGARIEFVTSANGDSDQDIAFQQILAVFDELTRKVTASLTKAAMLRQQAAGTAMGSRPPFGKRLGPVETKTMPSGKERRFRRLLDDPVEQTVIARIIELDAQGMGSSAIARRLHRDGLPFRGRQWHHTLVHRVLARAKREGAISVAS